MAMRRKYRRTMIFGAESTALWERWKKSEGQKAIYLPLGRRDDAGRRIIAA
jgi:hypothetical protein